MSPHDAAPPNAVEPNPTCSCTTGPRWGDPQLKRLFYATFIVGAGLGSIATSLAFGFWLV